MQTKFNVKKAVAAGLIVVVVILLAISSFQIVPTGYTGVRTTFGQVNQTVVQSGFHFKIPFVQSIKLVNNKQQDIVVQGQVWSETSEQTVLFMENVTVTYQISPEKSAWIYANVSDYQNNLVSNALVSSALKSSSVQLTTQDSTNRSKIEPIAKEEIQKALDEKYGAGTIAVLKVVINNMDFEDDYNRAIAQRQIAQMNYEQAQVENRTAVEKAEAEAEAARASAQGEADAERILAEAKAEANDIISASITEQTIRQDMIDKWDGRLPVVSGSDSVLIDPAALLNGGTAAAE